MTMAKPVCTYCDEYQGILMVTNLDDGETQVICPNDVIMWALSMAGQLTEGMTPEQSEQYGALLDQIAVNDARTAKPAGRKRAAKPAPATEAPPPPAEPDAPPTATVDLPEPCPECGWERGIGDAEKLACAACGEVLATADDAV